MRRRAPAALLALAVAALGGAGEGLAAGTPPEPRGVGPLEGMRAPSVTVRRLDGSLLRLEDLRGQVVLLNFWASWCGPCLAEMPDLERLWEEVRRDGVVVLAINVDIADPERLRAFVERTGLKLPVAMDPGGAARNAFRINPIPTTFILDKRGVVRYRILGARPWTHPDYAAGLRVLAAEPVGRAGER